MLSRARAAATASSRTSSCSRVLSTSAAPLREGGNPPRFALDRLRAPPGTRPSGKRVGRGPGSGWGKTAARGHGGKKSRSGLQGRVWFEGGQSPLIKRIPKHGFSRTQLAKPLKELSLRKLAAFVRAGRIRAGAGEDAPITLKEIYDSGAVGRFRHGVKLLADGGAHALEGLPPLHLEVSGASAAAREAVEKAGGKVKLVYFNKLGLRAYLKPEKFEILPKRARVPPRLAGRGLEVPSIDEQLKRAEALGKVLNPPYTYRDAPSASQ